MSVGNERKALLAIADHLCEELGFAESASEIPNSGAVLGGGQRQGLMGMLSEADEVLVTQVRWGLAKLAAAVGAARPPTGAPENAVAVALDGAELVMRGEMVRSNGSRLGSLMPSFVFLVTLPMVRQEEAIELSRRTSALVEKALRG